MRGAPFGQGGRPHGVDEEGGGVAQEVLDREAGLGEHVDGAAGQSLDSDRRVLAGPGRADHHGKGIGRHQPGEEGEAVHAGHLDVEHDDVRPSQRDTAFGAEGVGGQGHREFAGALQQLLEGLADHRGVVDHENVDHARSPFAGLR